MKNQRPLMLENKKVSDFPIGAYDIETRGLFGEYLDGFLKYEDDSRYYRASSMDEMLNRILSRWNVTLYAHNAAGYEHNYLIDALKKRDDININVIVAGTKIIGLIIVDPEDKYRRIELKDSLALFDPSTSLKKACIALNVDGGKTSIGLDEGVIYDPSNLQHQEYCKNDVRVTIEVVKNYSRDVYSIFGNGIGFTAASTALSNWKSTIPKGTKYYRMQKPVEPLVREAYFGGFVYPGKSMLRQEDIISVDRTAAYAAAMLEGVPYGKAMYTTLFMDDMQGIYSCDIITPAYHDDFIPLIPYRDNGLKWPTGSFRTSITSVEIQFAREHGYQIDVIEGYVFPQWIYPFNDFVNKCQKVEIGEPEKKMTIKISRNSLYGKFGSKLFNDEYHIGTMDNPEWFPLVNYQTGEVNFSVYGRTIENNSNYIMPHWACFITAHQRIWLMKHMMAIGGRNIVYGDTDSIKARKSAVVDYFAKGNLSLDPFYGNVKIDEEYLWFQCLGPKVYYGELIDGKSKMRAKGIPYRSLEKKLFEDAYDGKFWQIEYTSSNSALTRLKDPRKQLKIDAVRSITNFRNSKSWQINREGNIFPPHIEN